MRNRLIAACMILLASSLAAPARAAEPQAFQPIQPMPTGSPVTLTGHDLTLDQIIRVARFGEKVELSPEAVRHQDDAYRLLLEGAAEGVPIAGFNRTADGARAVFEGDPALPDNAAAIGRRLLSTFRGGAADPAAPELTQEELIRAAMVVRANTLVYTAASTSVSQLLLAFLNDRVTPVAASAADIAHALGAAMVGAGDVHLAGSRVTAAEALSRAGLMPLEPVGMDDRALMEGDFASVAEAALLAADTRQALNWGDMVGAMDLDAANGNLAALSVAAEANRPYRWVNWDALRLLDMLKGSYLFEADTGRGAALPAVLRQSLIAQGDAWTAWGALRDVLAIALNSSDQSPAVRVGLSSRESFELGTPLLAKFLVKGGKGNGGRRGYIVDTINADPASLRLAIDGFTIAIAALDRAIAERAGTSDSEPETADGAPAAKGRAASIEMLRLLRTDFVAGATALDRLGGNDGKRDLGVGPNSVLTAWHDSLTANPPAPNNLEDAALAFIQANPVGTFFRDADVLPGSDDQVPLAQERIRR